MDIGFSFKGSSAIVVNADCFQIDSHCVLIDDPAANTSYIKLSDSIFRNSGNGVVVNKNDSRVHINSCVFKTLSGTAVKNTLNSPYVSQTANVNW